MLEYKDEYNPYLDCSNCKYRCVRCIEGERQLTDCIGSTAFKEGFEAAVKMINALHWNIVDISYPNEKNESGAYVKMVVLKHVIEEDNADKTRKSENDKFYSNATYREIKNNANQTTK